MLSRLEFVGKRTFKKKKHKLAIAPKQNCFAHCVFPISLLVSKMSSGAQPPPWIPFPPNRKILRPTNAQPTSCEKGAGRVQKNHIPKQNFSPLVFFPLLTPFFKWMVAAPSERIFLITCIRLQNFFLFCVLSITDTLWPVNFDYLSVTIWSLIFQKNNVFTCLRCDFYIMVGI